MAKGERSEGCLLPSETCLESGLQGGNKLSFSAQTLGQIYRHGSQGGYFVFLQKDKAAKANTAASKASWKQRSGSVIGKYVDGRGILRR
jgi:hypothetical protein